MRIAYDHAAGAFNTALMHPLTYDVEPADVGPVGKGVGTAGEPGDGTVIVGVVFALGGGIAGHWAGEKIRADIDDWARRTSCRFRPRRSRTASDRADVGSLARLKRRCAADTRIATSLLPRRRAGLERVGRRRWRSTDRDRYGDRARADVTRRSLLPGHERRNLGDTRARDGQGTSVLESMDAGGRPRRECRPPLFEAGWSQGDETGCVGFISDDRVMWALGATRLDELALESHELIISAVVDGAGALMATGIPERLDQALQHLDAECASLGIALSYAGEAGISAPA